MFDISFSYMFVSSAVGFHDSSYISSCQRCMRNVPPAPCRHAELDATSIIWHDSLNSIPLSFGRTIIRDRCPGQICKVTRALFWQLYWQLSIFNFFCCILPFWGPHGWLHGPHVTVHVYSDTPAKPTCVLNYAPSLGANTVISVYLIQSGVWY